MGDAKEVLNGSAEEKYRKGHGVPHPGFHKEGRKDNKIPEWAKAGLEAEPNLPRKSNGGGAKEAQKKEFSPEEDKDDIQPHETDDHDHHSDAEADGEQEAEDSSKGKKGTKRKGAAGDAGGKTTKSAKKSK